MEIELKLLAARGDLERVLDSSALNRRALGRVRTSTVLSTYYDTSHCDLERAHLALRLRRLQGTSGARWVQALKGRAPIAAGLAEREEYEWPVRSRRLELALLDTTPYAAVFAKRSVRTALRPAFTTRFERSVVELALGEGGRGELCADFGEIRAGNRRARVCEVEIELKSGAPAELFDFAGELLAEVPLRPGTQSKAERGYALSRSALSRSALSRSEPARPRRATDIALRDEMSGAEVLRAIGSECLAQICANEGGFLRTRDPEYLHQLRVGLRRLRVALALQDEEEWRASLEPVRAEMRWLASVLGPVRNWDVFLSESLAPLLGRFGDAALPVLRERCERQRRRRLAHARAELAGPRFPALIVAVGRLLYGYAPAAPEGEATARSLARAAIRRREQALLRRGEGLSDAGPEQLHRLRIAAKKLRYCAEFFAALYPHKKMQRYVDALSDLQDVLGAINDAAVGSRLIAEVAAGGRAYARAGGIVQGWIAAGEAAAKQRLAQAWKKFERCGLLSGSD